MHMSKIIVSATPAAGHTGPLLRIAAHLSDAGHEVVFLGGSRYAEQAKEAGLAFQALPEEADYDDRDFVAAFPQRELVPAGPDRTAWDVMHVFGDPIPSQAGSLRHLLADFPASVVIYDNLFLGAVALAMTEPGSRPTMISVGISPLGVPSRDTAPHMLGLLPPVDDAQRAQYAAIAEQMLAAGRPMVEHLVGRFAAAGVTHPEEPMTRVWTESADHFVQLTVPGFEYPRTDLPANVSFVGALPLPAGAGQELPDWWPELTQARAQGRRVVVVTQGTLANADLTTLVVPTVQALAERADVLLVAATARPDGAQAIAAELSVIPANTRAVGYVPFDALLPFADVLVTNGGYGGVQAALGHGVPVVVAGETEDKPEVAARVEWSGTGRNLRTARPTVEALAAAVDTVLTTPSYREQAAELRTELSRYDALELITALITTADQS